MMAFHSKEKSENRFFSFPDISRHFPTLPTFPDCRDLSGQVGTARGGGPHIEKSHITLSISIYLFPMGVSFSVQGVSFSVQAFSCTLYPVPKLGVGTPFFAR